MHKWLVLNRYPFHNEKYSQGEWKKLGWHDLFDDDVSNLIQGSYPFLNDLIEEDFQSPLHQTRSAGNLRLPFPRFNIHRQTTIYNGL